MAQAPTRRARPELSAEVQEQFQAWGRLTDRDPSVRLMNLKTQFKIALIHVVFLGALYAHHVTGGHWAVSLLSVVVLGMFALPFLRVFMHSQGHWRVGNGAVRNFILDHGVSLLFSVPQTGYKLGHLAHHRYDNDYDPHGYPRDLQSTYLFSKDGRPGNIWAWVFFYLVIYQHAVHLFHVLNHSSRRVLVSYVFEYALIIGMHAAMLVYVPAFYLQVYLPSLVLSWLVAALALYKMHDIGVSDSPVHATLTSLDPILNWFGDNDGYHVEHSLYPKLHPLFLKQAHTLLNLPEQNVLHANYVLAALPSLLGRKNRPAPQAVEALVAEPAPQAAELSSSLAGRGP